MYESQYMNGVVATAQQQQQSEPEAPQDKGPSHSEIKGYIRTNVSTVYNSATGKNIPPATERHRDNSSSQPQVSVSYNSSAKQYAAFVLCNKRTFLNGRPAPTLTLALLNLLEASSELMDMWGKGLLQEGEAGVCMLRESGGRYWNGHKPERGTEYRSSSSI